MLIEIWIDLKVVVVSVWRLRSWEIWLVGERLGGEKESCLSGGMDLFIWEGPPD